VPLSGFDIVQEHSQQDQVLVQCFDGAQTVLVFISHREIAIYFRRYDLTPRQNNLLISSNMEKLVSVISGRYERGEVSLYASPTGRAYPSIELTAADLAQASKKLTNIILDIDARAGFQPLFNANVSHADIRTSEPPRFGFAEAGDRAGFGEGAFPPVEAGDAPGSPPEPIPLQGAGPHFTIGAAGQIALAPPPELDAAGNDIGRIRQFLPMVRRAAADLADAVNPNQFTVLSGTLDDYRAAIAADAPEIAWGVVFGLGVRLGNAADAAQRQIEDRLLPALEDPAQEALQSLNILHGSLIMATAEGRELEEQADRLQMTRDQQAAFRAEAVAIAAKLHRAVGVIEPQADKIVTDAAEVIGEGRHPERGSAFGIAAFRNVTTVLVSAGAVIAMSAALGWVGAGVAWVGLKGLEKSRTFAAAMTALGKGFDILHEIDAARLGERLTQIAPLRRFIVDNQKLLRGVASNLRQMSWMVPYIDFIVPQDETNGVTPPDLELSFDQNDPECLAQVPVYLIGQAGTVKPSWFATSIRVRAQVNNDLSLQNVMAYIAKIEKQIAGGDWQISNYPQIQTTWTDTDDILTDIPGKAAKYINVIHIDHPENKITVYQRQKLSISLQNFTKDLTTYRFTVSVMAQGVTAKVAIEIDWKGNWETIQVRSASA
jgi:hypothetical protein